MEKIVEDNYRKNKDYQKLTQWCVKKTKMNEVLEKAGFKILKFDAQGQTPEKKQLDAKIKELSENNKEFLNLKSSTVNAIGDSNTVNVDNLKKGCVALKTNELETIKDDFLSKFYLAKEVCFVKK